MNPDGRISAGQSQPPTTGITLLNYRKPTALLLDHPWPVILCLTVLTLFFAAQLRRAEFSREMHGDLPQGDPELIYFEQFVRQFGDSEILVVGVEADELFTPAGLAWLDQLTRKLAAAKWVRQALSLANAVELQSGPAGIRSQPFLEPPPQTVAQAEEFRRRALEHPEWVKNLISADGRAVAINLFLPSFTDDSSDRLQAVADIRELLRANAHPRIKTHLTGISAILRDSMDLARQDLRRFIWFTPLLIMLLLFLAFRTLRGVLIPLTVVNLAVVWTVGLYIGTGHKITMVSTMMPTLIAVICISDVIHILAFYYREAGRLAERREIILSTMQHMAPACLLTSLTTALGFASLAISQIKSVREFGLWSALGIMFSYLLAVTLTPLILARLPLPAGGVQERYNRAAVSRLLRAVAAQIARDRLRTPLLALLALLISLLAILRLRVETQMSTFLPDSAPSKIGLQFINENFSGFSTLEVAVQGAPGTFKQPWAVAELGELEDWLLRQPVVDSAMSYRDLIVKLHQSAGDGGPRQPLPDSEGEIEEYLLLFSMSDQPEVQRAFVTEDYSTARISARLKSRNSRAQQEFIAAFEASGRATLDPRLSLRTTGALKLFIMQITALVHSQIRSIAFSFIVIMLLLMLYFRSFKLGLISMIPNVLPVLMTLGLMGATGITLNLSTVMISCVAIGIAVDDTIHFLSRFRLEFEHECDALLAIRRTLEISGRAIVFTSVILAGGFCIFALSNFGPNRYFGILTSFTMIAALFADLFLLPFLIRMLYRR